LGYEEPWGVAHNSVGESFAGVVFRYQDGDNYYDVMLDSAADARAGCHPATTSSNSRC